MILKTVKFLYQQLVLIGIQLIKEYKSIVNGFIKRFKQSGKTLLKLHLAKILKIIFLDHHLITSK